MTSRKKPDPLTRRLHMPRYEVRLESPVDSQARIVSLDADNEQAARTAAEESEQNLAGFSLLPPDEDVWAHPPGTDPDEPDVLVDLSRWDAHDKQWANWASELPYDKAVKAAEDRIDV